MEGNKNSVSSFNIDCIQDIPIVCIYIMYMYFR